ncbi:MAG: O-antigen ligase family protein [Luteolibacter sp.]
MSGLDDGGRVTPQPTAALGSLVTMVASGVVTIWAASQSVGVRHQRRLGACFAVAVCTYALAAWIAPGCLNFESNAFGTYGFFPNRNHTATLLVMGSLVSLGLLAQGLRWRQGWMIAIGTSGLVLLVGLLFGLNISRAGILLLGIGLILWVALTGPRYLGGHLGKAVAILSGGALLYFLQIDTVVKDRINGVIERVAPDDAQTSDRNRNSSLVERLESADGRVAIHRDTAKMITDAPLTGWGAGQFRFVFPQYRSHSANLNHATCLHPESDWLWLTAETGIPATAALIALLAAMVFSAARSIRNGRARGLRAAFLVAAVILPIHGIIDVPGHSFSLLWISAALLAMAVGSKKTTNNPRISAAGWRFTGAAVAALGVLLVHAEWTGAPLPATNRSITRLGEALELYRADLENATRQKTVEAKSPDNLTHPDLLELGLAKLEEATSLTPMDPQVHGLRAMLALHFEDKDWLARRSFAAQRQLDPGWVKLPLIQADAWAKIDPTETQELWQEAMRRAARMEQIQPATPWRVMTYDRILKSVRTSSSLHDAAIEIAGDDVNLLKLAANLPHPKGAKHAR